MCGAERLLHRLAKERLYVADHSSDHPDLRIRLRWLSSRPGLGLLRRRRAQPDPDYRTDPAAAEGYLIPDQTAVATQLDKRHPLSVDSRSPFFIDWSTLDAIHFIRRGGSFARSPSG